MLIRTVFTVLLLTASAYATTISRTSVSVRLGETDIAISVYEREGSNLVLFVPHFNEQIAVASAKAAVARVLDAKHRPLKSI